MSAPGIGQSVDEADLEAELEELQQEQLDEQMLKTGTVPVADAVHKMPSPANQERKSRILQAMYHPSQMMMTNPSRAAVSSKKQTVEEDDDAELEKLRAEMAM